MRIGLATLITVATLGVATLAYAADWKITGKIKSIDLIRHTVTMDNGMTYDVANGINLIGMKAGQKVTLTYTQTGKRLEASAVKPEG